MTFELQFVDRITNSPTVRLNLMAAPWILRDTTEFGQPELRRSAVSTLLADGDAYPAAAYGNRVITLVLQADQSASDDDIAAAMQKLSRELDRPTNILLYRPGTSSPVFFRTFRSTPSSVVWDPVLKQVQAQIPAEPFALGLKENPPLRSATNDPATGGLYFEITPAEAKGDVEAPLYLSFKATDLTPTTGTWSPGYGRRRSVIAVRRGGNPSQAPLVLQAEAMSPTTDTTLQANDLAMSGSGQNFTRTTFVGTASMQGRLTIAAFPAVASPDVRGTYRAFARVRKTVGTDTIQMRMSYALDSSGVSGDIVTLPGGTVPRWVDLGTVQLPMGYDPRTDGLSGAPLSVRGVQVDVQAARVSGTGALDIDMFAFVPADDRYCAIRWPEYGNPTSYILDSAANQVYAVGASGEVRAIVAEMQGLPPMVSPGVINRIVFLRDVGSETTTGDQLTATVLVDTYYWPRYLHVRPVSS